MARKSVKASEARERARERANRFLAREHQLLEIAEEHEAVRLELEQIDEATEARIAKIREQAEAKVAEAREQASESSAAARERSEQIQLRMLDLGTSRREIGERLGIATRDVVRRAAAPADTAVTEQGLEESEELESRGAGD